MLSNGHYNTQNSLVQLKMSANLRWNQTHNAANVSALQASV